MSEEHKDNDKEWKNRPPVDRFILEMRANNLSISTINWYLDKLGNIRKINDKPFEEWDEQDTKEVMAAINSKGLSGWTRYGYRSCLRKFFRTINKPEIVAWIKLEPQKIKVEYDILTKEEIQRMIEKADSLRDKAIVSVLYESGCRSGEFASLKTDDVAWDEHGCILNVKKSKTEPRPIRIIEYCGFLEMYLRHRDYKSDWLWIALDNCSKGHKLSVKAIRKILKKLGKRAGISKRIYPHIFRHSRATHLGNFLTDSQRCVFFGWIRGSNMLKVYDHLLAKDVDKRMIELFYPQKVETEEKKVHSLKEFV